MIIKKLKISHFGLIKEATIYPSNLNVITGINNDVNPTTGNSVGKSTIQNAITFAIFGEVPGINLTDLISFGCVFAQVECEIDNLKIIRKIPNKVEIYEDDVKLDFNTSSIAQDYLNKRYGTLEQFKKYRAMDINKGLNLLDYCADSRSIVSLRKELMSFIDDMFSSMRKGLLDKKLNCETYSIDKRLYKYFLSEKRITIYDKGIIKLTNDLKEAKQDWLTQSDVVNQIKSDIQIRENNINQLAEDLTECKETVSENETTVSNYRTKINEIKEQPLQSLPEIINYDDLLKQKDNEMQTNAKELEGLEKEIVKIEESINTINQTITAYDSDIKNYKKQINQIQSNIAEVGEAKSGIRCDKCGSPITEENKEGYKLDESKKLEELGKSLSTLNLMVDEQTQKLLKKKNELTNKETEKYKLDKKIKDIRNEINDLNTKKFNQEQEVNRIKNLVNTKVSEIKKYEELIDTYLEQNKKSSFQLIDINANLVKQNTELETLKKKLIEEQDALDYMNNITETIEKKKNKTESYLLKLREAFKFIEYKYTPKDVMLYTEAIKTLDLFASSYVQEYLSQLSIIMNDLLKVINITINFVDNKEFIEIKENNRKLKYTQLSSGQKKMLGILFKISILLQQGETNGIILVDEGINELHKVNFSNLIEILKGLNFQIFCIYQNLPELKDVNIINLIRKNGVTEVK